MQKDFNHFVHQKQRRKRFVTIFLITLVSAATAVFVQECNQNFDGPYNKDYQPMDQVNKNNNRNVP